MKPAALTLLLTLSGLTASAATLSGTVLSSTGTPLAGIPIKVMRISATTGNLVSVSSAQTSTSTNGTFTTVNLSAGNYWVRAENVRVGLTGLITATGYEGAYHHPAGTRPDRDSASPIVITAATPAVTGLNLTLRPAFSVTGTVEPRSSVDSTLIDFDVEDAVTGRLLPLITTRANNDGTYALHGFPVGTYRIQCDPDPSLGFFPVYQGDVFRADDAVPLAISGPATLNFNLSPGFAISGVVSADGLPVPGIDIDVYELSPAGYRFVPDAAVTSTNTPGVYATGNLPPGQYVVKADPAPGDFLALSYHNAAGQQASFVEQASVLPLLTAGVTNAHIALVSGASLGGFVTTSGGAPAAGMDLDVFDAAGTRMEQGGSVLADGSYQVGPLPAGDYLVRADPTAGQSYVRVYHPAAAFRAEAAPVAVTGGVDVAGVNMMVAEGGWVEGSVSLPGGGAATNLNVDILNEAGRVLEMVGHTDAAGHFRLGPVAAGNHRVRADPDAARLLARVYHPAALAEAGGALVPVTALQTNLGVNIQLSAAGAVAGTVRDALGSPLAGVDLDVFDAVTLARIDVSAATGADGSYLVGPLNAGSVLVRAQPVPGDPHLTLYHPGALFIEQAAAVPVAVGAIQSGRDFSLPTGGFIAGMIVSAADGQPAAGIDLDLYDGAGLLMEVNAASDGAGGYRIGPVPAGSYTLRADPSALQFLCRTYHPDTLDSALAQPIPVAGPGPDATANFSLAGAGAISGVVRDALGAPLPGIDIDVYTLSGLRVDADASSAVDGTFLIGPIPAGEVVVRADPDADQPWVREWYAEADRVAAAMSILAETNVESGGIDFTLDSGSTISGLITGTNGLPLAGIDLDVYALTGGAALEQTALSGPDGRYTLGPVPAGSWAVRANPTAIQGYETRYFTAAGSITNAVPVPVGAGTPAAAVNFVLGRNDAPVARLSPFAGIQPDGSFSLAALASTDSNGDRLVFRWRQLSGPALGVSDPAAASPVFSFAQPGDGSVAEIELVARDFSIDSAPVVLRVRNGAPLIEAAVRPDGTLSLDWTLGAPAQPYTLQVSPDLVNWQAVSGAGAFHAVHPGAEPRAYFRVQAGGP